MNPQGQSNSLLDMNNLQDSAMNIVYNFCSVVACPIEMALRPQYGSRYFSPVVMFFSALMMIFLPLLSGFADGIGQIAPFLRGPAPLGLFGIATLSKLFFLGSMVHGWRIWRRMIHMDKEEHSQYEGPPLFIFRIIPGSFWTVRIVYEPVFVFTLGLVLPNLFILQPSAAHYLEFAAAMLAMKQYVAWFLQWQFLRGLMDMRNTAPVIARFVDNTATDEDLATVHLASLPKNIPDDLRRKTATHIARALTPGAENELLRGQSNEHSNE